MAKKYLMRKWRHQLPVLSEDKPMMAIVDELSSRTALVGFFKLHAERLKQIVRTHCLLHNTVHRHRLSEEGSIGRDILKY